MSIIEFNPTHIETPDKGFESGLERGENRLDNIKPQEEDRKSEAPENSFAKLLASLISKKSQKDVSQDALEGEALQAVREKATLEKGSESNNKRKFFLFTGNSGKEESLTKAENLKDADGKKQRIIPKKPEEQSSSFIKGEKQPKKSEKQDQTGKEELGFVMARHTVSDSAKEKEKENDFVMELAKDVKKKDRVELSVLKREVPEVSILEGLRTVQPKKDEKLAQTNDSAETKKTSGKKTVVQVRDLRTQTGQEAGSAVEQSVKGVEKTRTEQEREIVLDIRPSWERSEEPASEVKPGKTGETFSQILSRELNGGLSTDIVRQAVIVLKDGGEGTIKLALRPESLGKVKIQLEMSENKILGQIIVESEEALRAFEQEIHTLEQSFKDSGFEASLSAALDYRNDGQRWKENEARPFFSGRFADSYEETSSIFGEKEGGSFYDRSAVNIFA